MGRLGRRRQSESAPSAVVPAGACFPCDSRRSLERGRGSILRLRLITKKSVALDDFHNGRWNELFPGRITGLDFGEDIMAANGKAGRAALLNILKETIFEQMFVKVLQVRRDGKILRG